MRKLLYCAIICLLLQTLTWARQEHPKADGSRVGRGEKNRLSFPTASDPPNQKSKFSVAVDPRIELLSVVQLLSGYVVGASLINTDATRYRRHLDVYFAAHRGHPAVKMFGEMYPKGFYFELPPKAMLYYSDPPRLVERQPVPEDVKRRAGGERQLNDFIAALRDFARATKFMSFYNAHRRDYRRMTDGMRAGAKSIDLIGVLEDYYGVKQRSYNVMLMPLAVELGFGVNVQRDGGLDVYQMIGRGSVKDGFPVFGEGGKFSLQNLVWHEFGHSFVNPLTERHRAEVSKYAALYEPIARQMKERAYPAWEHAVNEHIIRAVTSRLAARETGKETGDRELLENKAEGFLYVEPLAERLKEYENGRGRYPTFADFYPRLIDVFREIQESKSPDKR